MHYYVPVHLCFNSMTYLLSDLASNLLCVFLDDDDNDERKKGKGKDKKNAKEKGSIASTSATAPGSTTSAVDPQKLLAPYLSAARMVPKLKAFVSALTQKDRRGDNADAGGDEEEDEERTRDKLMRGDSKQISLRYWMEGVVGSSVD